MSHTWQGRGEAGVGDQGPSEGVRGEADPYIGTRRRAERIGLNTGGASDKKVGLGYLLDWFDWWGGLVG